MTLLDLIRRLPNEATAASWFESVRWPDGRKYCPKCGSAKTRKTHVHKPMPYWCGGCRSYFSVRTGTVMQATNLTLRKWVFALFYMLEAPESLSSYRMAALIGVTQKTAWTLMHKIREGFDLANLPKLTGTVEADETYVGGQGEEQAR